MTNYWFNTKNKKNARNIKNVIIILLLFILLIIYLTAYVNPKILDASHAEIKSLAITEINKSIKEVSQNKLLYDDLINISYTTSGDVSMISTNSYQINMLSSNIIEKCQEKLTSLGEKGIQIKLGNFSGIAFLSNIGPNITIKMKPIGQTQVNLSSYFKSQGINQTLHEVYLKANCIIKVILPIRTLNIEVNNEVLIAESVIVGKIPDTYLSADKIFSLY